MTVPPSGAARAIRARGLRFAWPGHAELLAIDELDVPAGGSLFLHGPSGCGKSTLLGLLGGVLAPAAGELEVLGEPFHRLGGAARDRIRGERMGYVFQQFNLLPYLSVLDNVLLPCRFSARRRQRCPEGAVASAQRLLARMDLPAALWGRRADALSVGQQQRVAAARALIGQPELVIADEPTSALDESLRDRFMALLMAECRDGGSTLVFVSHDQRLATMFDRRLALADWNRAAPVADAPPALAAA
jgi:putative ABC transport system ATP-binding protein